MAKYTGLSSSDSIDGSFVSVATWDGQSEIAGEVTLVHGATVGKVLLLAIDSSYRFSGVTGQGNDREMFLFNAQGPPAVPDEIQELAGNFLIKH
jgi:hypothetical protein